MLATQTQMPPPKPPVNKKIASGFPDDIRQLGDQIAALPKCKLRELSRYIRKFVKGLF